MLRFRSLGSGSSGNVTVIEAASGLHTTRLLVDCGLSTKVLLERLGRAGLGAEQVDAVFVTHEHSDHIGCAREFALRFCTPVWMSLGTHLAAGEGNFAGHLRLAQDGVNIDLGELQVKPFTVPHDAREPLQLRCSDGSRHVGVLTDLGHATAHVLANLAGCHALLLECNHDAAMLAEGAYPPFLKQRVGGRFGHLSNFDAAQLAKSLDHPGLTHVIAAHLSRQNNRPGLAREALALALGRANSEIGVATQDGGFDWVDV